MTLEELLKLVPEANKAAVEAFFNGLNGKVTTLTAEITALESSTVSKDLQEKLDDAIKKRDAAKAQLTIVRDSLGLPVDKEVTRELVADHLKDASKGDAEKDRQIVTLKADIASLEEAVENIKTEKTNIEKERDQITEETKFIKVFSENMPDFKPASPRARVDIERLMRVDAVLEEGKIVYKVGGNYTRVDGDKLDMKTKLGQIQDDPELGYLFETKASGGSGSGNGGSGGNVSRFEQRKRQANMK